MNITFITGNQGKADFLAKHVDYPIKYQKVDLDEIQSLDLREVAEHKVRQAYDILKTPVLVEDVSMVISALGNLPGPFIKWFEQSLGLSGICKLVDRMESRDTVISVCFAYFDGAKLNFFEGSLSGKIASSPKGAGGFGFDPIFIPTGSEKTLAQMDEKELEKKSLRTTTVYHQLREFLSGLDSHKA